MIPRDVSRFGLPSASVCMEAAAWGHAHVVFVGTGDIRRVWGWAGGPAPAGEKAFQRLYPRRDATLARARRAAGHALAALPPGPPRAAVDAMPAPRGLDVWMYGAFERRAGIVPTAAVPVTTAKAACDEFGALSAFLARLLGAESLSWPLLAAARTASGGMQRHRRNPARLSTAVAPREARAWLEAHPPQTQRERRDAAALALGSTLGLPVTMTSHLRTREVTLVHDGVPGWVAAVLGYEVREQGGLKVRRATSTAPVETIWTAASSWAVHTFLTAWWRHARDAKWEFLFPRISRSDTGAEVVSDEPMPTADLQAAARSIRADATWHCLRFGVARALVGAHHVDGGPRDPVALEVKNTIQLRSNSKLLGSGDAYILDNVDPIFAATRVLDRVNITRVGGLASATGRVREMPGEHALSGKCWRCGATVGLEDDGYVCSYPSCDQVVCVPCTTAAEADGDDMWCAAQR